MMFQFLLTRIVFQFLLTRIVDNTFRNLYNIAIMLQMEHIWSSGRAYKLSVNMNVGTLSQIDLLVDLGYYSNRSDFINQSVRQSLDQIQSIIENETP